MNALEESTVISDAHSLHRGEMVAAGIGGEVIHLYFAGFALSGPTYHGRRAVYFGSVVREDRRFSFHELGSGAKYQSGAREANERKARSKAEMLAMCEAALSFAESAWEHQDDHGCDFPDSCPENGDAK